MERTELSAFFLTSFAFAGVKILHLDICRCTAHHGGEQNDARIKSISPTVSDLRSQKKQSSSSSSSSYSFIMIMMMMNVQIVFTFFKVRISWKPR